MKRTRLTAVIAVLLMAAGLFGVRLNTVQAAAPGITTLKLGQEYTQYDIDGDGRSDTLTAVSVDNGPYNYAGVEVHVTYDAEEFVYGPYYGYGSAQICEVTVQLCTLKNGASFLYIKCSGENGDGENVLIQCKPGEKKTIIDFEHFFGKHGNHQWGCVESVKGNTLKSIFSVCTYSLGGMTCSFDYVYKNGTLVPKSKTGKLVNMPEKKYCADKTLKVYTKAGGNKLAYTVPKSSYVSVKNVCRVSKGSIWIKVKQAYGSKKQGWLRLSKKGKGRQFSNGHWYG